MSKENRINIVFMHSHNTGAYVQPYGHAVPTPNLQRMAEDGVLFRQAFATAPTCSPSRASFLSGMYPHSCGMLGLGHRGFAMKDYGLHAVRTFKANGYYTVGSGVEHTAPDLSVIGYDAMISNEDTNYPDLPNRRDPAGAAVEFLSSSPQQPFFLNLGLNETHRPLHKAEPERFPAEDARYCTPPRPLPDTPEMRADMADFKASARVMDAHYGAVLDALDAAGLAENTLVFCFADHGLQFPRNMCNLTDHGLRVYLIVRGPGGFLEGKVVDPMVSLMDLLPTAYDVAGIEIPNFVEGKSIRPLLDPKAVPLHEAVFGEVNYHAAYEPMRCVRTERYKYIRRYDNRDRTVLPNVDDTPSKAFLLEQGFADQARDQEMLFDLTFDPDEADNLAGRPELAAVQAELGQKLDAWMQATGDPILETGHVPAPSGSRVNDSDGQSPKDPPQVMP